MQVKPDQLAAKLKRGLDQVYLVAGEELLLMQESLDAIRGAARAQGYSEREVLDVERGFDWQRLVDSCASMSLFASRRIVEVRMAAGPDDAGRKVLLPLVAQMPPDVLLILSCGALDARARKSAWFRDLDAAGVSVYCWPVKAAELHDWLRARLRSAGVDADDDALRLLAERTEGNLLAAAQDIDKLALLYPGQRVGAEALTQAVADSARFGAFDLNQRVLDGDAVGAVRSLGRLREEGLSPLEVLGALAWSLRQLARAAFAYTKTRDAASACESVGIRRFQQAPYLKALSRARAGETLAWLGRAATVDRMVKTGQESAAWEELLTLILAASGAAARKTR